MAGDLQRDEQKNMQPRILYPGSLSFRRRYKGLPKQTKTEGICHHETSPTRDPKGESCETKYQRHHYKHETYRHHNDSKPISFYNNTECKWTKWATKRHRASEWIKKQDSSICCLQETHFRPEDTFRLKVRGWRTIYHATGS